LNVLVNLVDRDLLQRHINCGIDTLTGPAFGEAHIQLSFNADDDYANRREGIAP
jgi:hypothetical protein